MHYNVPQFIDIEDTLVGPLTAKQLLWLFAMAGVLLIMWFNFGEKTIFVAFAIPISMLFLAFAFYRPNGQSFLSFVGHALTFLVRPKIYIWRRDTDRIKSFSNKNKKSDNLETGENKKIIKQEEIIELAKILDSESEIIKK